jgi:hypothetical protein
MQDGKQISQIYMLDVHLRGHKQRIEGVLPIGITQDRRNIRNRTSEKKRKD